MNPDNITPTQQPQVPSHHVSNSMKIVMLLLGIALVATLGYFTWFVGAEETATQETAPSVKDKTEETTGTSETTTDETADWKTYTNATYGLSFKYPSDWTTKETDLGTHELIEFTKPDKTKLTIVHAAAATKAELGADGSYTLASWLTDKFVSEATKITEKTYGATKFTTAVMSADPSYFTALSVSGTKLYAFDFTGSSAVTALSTEDELLLESMEIK